LLGVLFARLLGKPYLLIVYDIYPDIAVNLGLLAPRTFLTRYWDWVTRLIFRHAAVLVVIGRDMADIVCAKVPPHIRPRVTLIPNWSDERHIRPMPHEKNPFREEQGLNGHFVVQYAGRMGRTHNLEPLIETAKALAGEPIVFQFIGEGAKKPKLQALAQKYNLDNVVFLPYQPMERLPEMLSAADLAVVCLEKSFTGLSVPSKAYGILASGTPILGFMADHSEISRVVRETGCGLTIEEPAPAQLTAVVRALKNDPQQRQEMADAGRLAFLRHYTLTRAAEAYDRVLNDMLAA
jgi:glycosyltransferase involved in cell wall biosynthesis